MKNSKSLIKIVGLSLGMIVSIASFTSFGKDQSQTTQVACKVTSNKIVLTPKVNDPLEFPYPNTEMELAYFNDFSAPIAT